MQAMIDFENRFNSILVRLKGQGMPARYLAGVFQFHTGSIKSWDETIADLEVDEFQFHTGSIKSFLMKSQIITTGVFQFHTGSIKRPQITS